jgi:transposase-like protein
MVFILSFLGRIPRYRGFRKSGYGKWKYDKLAIFILIERNEEEYIPSSNVESKAILKIISKRISKDLIICTDNFKSYLILNEVGYKHEYVNHSIGEYVKVECHINNCGNGASILRGICKDNLKLYLTALKICRRLGKIKPTQAIINI